jgi:hypothetical protein
MSIRQWIMLNNTTVRVEEILSIEMCMDGDEYMFTVIFKTLKVMKVNLNATGGKWLYVVCQQGVEEAKVGGEQYERL